MTRIKNGNIIEILLLFLPYCKKYRGDEREALASLIDASSPFFKKFGAFKPKGIGIFYRIDLSPNAFLFINFLFAKIHKLLIIFFNLFKINFF